MKLNICHWLTLNLCCCAVFYYTTQTLNFLARLTVTVTTITNTEKGVTYTTKKFLGTEKPKKAVHIHPIFPVLPSSSNELDI